MTVVVSIHRIALSLKRCNNPSLSSHAKILNQVKSTLVVVPSESVRQRSDQSANHMFLFSQGGMAKSNKEDYLNSSPESRVTRWTMKNAGQIAIHFTKRRKCERLEAMRPFRTTTSGACFRKGLRNQRSGESRGGFLPEKEAAKYLRGRAYPPSYLRPCRPEKK